MNKIWIIIQREYLTRVRRKAFIVTTLLAPLGFLLLMFSSVFISMFSTARTDVAVIDESGLFKEVVFPDQEGTIYFHKTTESIESAQKELDKKEESKFQAVMMIPANFNINTPNNPAISLRYVKRPGMTKRDYIKKTVNTAVSGLRFKVMNVDPEIREKMTQEVKLNFESLEQNGEKKGYEEAATIFGFVMAFAIYISLFFYGTMIMKGVMEEKTNRIIEVITSSVKPFQMLMGKIMGIGAVGLTQFLIWIILIAIIQVAAMPLIIMMGGSQAAATPSGMEQVDTDELNYILSNFSQLPFLEMGILFIVFFLGGFLLYGSLFAAIGAAMGEDSDQQSLMIPVTVPIVISVMIAVNVMNDPDSTLGFWGSIIPFTSPVVMCALLPFKPVWWQIALSIILLIAGFLTTTYMAARIYRVGILMYGKKVSLKQMAKWVFSKD